MSLQYQRTRSGLAENRTAAVSPCAEFHDISIELSTELYCPPESESSVPCSFAFAPSRNHCSDDARRNRADSVERFFQTCSVLIVEFLSNERFKVTAVLLHAAWCGCFEALKRNRVNDLTGQLRESMPLAGSSHSVCRRTAERRQCRHFLRCASACFQQSGSSFPVLLVESQPPVFVVSRRF